MVTLSQIIQYLYPNASPLVDFIVQTDEQGERITYWNTTLGAQPTGAEIEAARPSAQTYWGNQAASDAQAENDLQTLKSQGATAVSTNDSYIAITNPTNAQVAAQVKELTRQNTKIIKTILRIIKLEGK